MNASLWDSIRAGLVLPLLLVGVLAGVLGFLAGRGVYDEDTPARVSVITTRGEPAAAPGVAGDEATPGPEVSGGSERGEREPGCPAGCTCRFPRGGVIIRCGGSGTASVTTSEETSTPRPVPQGPPPSPPDLPGFG